MVAAAARRHEDLTHVEGQRVDTTSSQVWSSSGCVCSVGYKLSNLGRDVALRRVACPRKEREPGSVNLRKETDRLAGRKPIRASLGKKHRAVDLIETDRNISGDRPAEQAPEVGRSESVDQRTRLINCGLPGAGT